MEAVFTYEPYLGMLENNGRLHRLFDSRSLPEIIMDVLAVRIEAAQRQADRLRNLIAGHFQALDLWRKNPMKQPLNLDRLFFPDYLPRNDQ